MYKIMLVEDEDIIRSGLKHLIGEVIGGFRVVAEAKDGLEALELLKLQLPDLLITDIRMNQMGGVELIEHVRVQFPDLAVLIISGYNDFAYAKKAIQYRVEDYLLKPVNRVELAHCLSKLKRILDAAGQNGSEGADGLGRDEGSDNQIIRKVKELIRNNLEQDLSLQLIADKIHMNRQYISTLFKLETGKNFTDYVIQSRMEKAKRLLKSTRLKIYEIAKMSGYDNTKYFMTVFKQMEGITPSEYREQSVQEHEKF
jgi:YesN/AraC family two-component response regulator